MSFESASIACTDQGNAVSCPLPTILSGGSVVVDVRLFAFAAGSRSNFAMAIGQQFDSNLNDNVATAATTVTAAPATFVVINTNDQGTGSLRQAITNSNANSGSTNQITFNIPGAGVEDDPAADWFAAATVPVVIDATTQPGFAGTPIIELNGAATSGVNGLSLNTGSAGSTIRGFAINRFTINAGVGGTGIIVNSAGNLIAGNYSGTDPTGTIALGNTTGVGVNAANNTIGGTTNADRNLIAANTGSGINVNPGATGTKISGNLIGTNGAGAAGLGNLSNGINIGNVSSITIGDALDTVNGRNIIAGNAFSGVSINASTATVSGIQIVGNYLGLAPSGTTARANNGAGISFSSSGWLHRQRTPLIDQNVISGNGTQGVEPRCDRGNWHCDHRQRHRLERDSDRKDRQRFARNFLGRARTLSSVGRRPEAPIPLPAMRGPASPSTQAPLVRRSSATSSAPTPMAMWRSATAVTVFESPACRTSPSAASPAQGEM